MTIKHKILILSYKYTTYNQQVAKLAEHQENCRPGNSIKEISNSAQVAVYINACLSRSSNFGKVLIYDKFETKAKVTHFHSKVNQSLILFQYLLNMTLHFCRFKMSRSISIIRKD